MEWESIIGLEVHAQLMTNSKMFSGAATAYGAEPNTQACIIDLAMPGTLPVVNREAIIMAIKFGLAINAPINQYSSFSRKNYFYPDLPKGYQISQHRYPTIGKGYLDIRLDEGTIKRINITRAQLEEDSGKSLHEDFHGMTGIDLNRAGVPLLEIITEPDMRNTKEAIAYLKTLHALLRYLDICDGNMQAGSFRCDVNISIRPKGQDGFNTRAEIKNLNSFRFIERTINYEIQRQINVLASGGEILPETRLYDDEKDETRAMRQKEAEHDYRYFPDPDLLPLIITDDMTNAVKKELPELPYNKHERFKKDYQLNDYDASILTATREMADYFETVINTANVSAKLAANWIIGDLLGALNKNNTSIIQSPITAKHLAGLLLRVEDNTISGKIAKEIFASMWDNEGTADELIEKKGLKQVTDTQAIEKMIDTVLLANPEELAAYRAGKTKLFGFFVGQAMKASKGKANPHRLNEVLKKKLETI